VIEGQAQGQRPSASSIVTPDPCLLPSFETDKPETVEFLRYLSEQAHIMSQAAGTPYRESAEPRDQSQYKEMLDFYRKESKRRRISHY
jgi:hypothetical protein